MKSLATLGSGQLLGSGIFPALGGEAPPLWKDGENVIFDHGGVRKNDGLLGLATPAARPTGLKSTIADGEARLFLGAGTSAYRYRASDGLTSIGSFAASGGIYQFVPWDTWSLISNGVDPVELWQNAGSSAPITAPFTRANTLFSYQLQAFAGGTNNGGQLVEWSPVNSVTDWTVTPTGTAGQLRLRELQGDIMAARPLGGSVGIYSQANAGIFTFIGGTSIYGFRKPISGVKAISPYSVVSLGDRHYGLTQENAFVTDLVSFRLVDEPAMRRYMDITADWDRVQETYGWPDWANGMCRWAVPKVGGGSFGIGHRIDNGAWTKFNDGVLLGEESGAFGNMLLAKTARLLRANKAAGDNDGAAITAYVQTKPLSLGDRNRFKRLSKISIDAEWTGAVSIRIGFTNHPSESVTWSITKDLANEIYPDEANVQSEFVFLHLEIRSTTASATWKLSGAEIFGEYAGAVSA